MQGQAGLVSGCAFCCSCSGMANCMNAMTGFLLCFCRSAAHAPVSKGLVLGAIGASVISNAARASRRRLPRPLVLLSQLLAFKSPGELLFGCVLLYYFRVLERQSGSQTYGTYAAVVTGLSCALQLGLSRLLHVEVPIAVGPLPLVFASFVPFMFDIPGTSHFSVLGWTMSDKVSVSRFQYLISWCFFDLLTQELWRYRCTQV